jgi:hypothetical protein
MRISVADSDFFYPRTARYCMMTLVGTFRGNSAGAKRKTFFAYNSLILLDSAKNIFGSLWTAKFLGGEIV